MQENQSLKGQALNGFSPESKIALESKRKMSSEQKDWTKVSM